MCTPTPQDEAKRRRTVAAADLIWTGREILHLRRFRDKLQAAHGLFGHNDELAYFFLEEALKDLQCVLGETAEPVVGLRSDHRRPAAGVRSPEKAAR